MRTIDLNCDVGERPEAIRDGTEEALLACVSSANIACGGHAGDDETMEATVRAALRHGVAVGAHPGYPDRASFGRAAMDMPADEIESTVAGQVETLGRIARRLGADLVHVKPHGALYHTMLRDPAIAEAIARGAAAWSRSLILVGFAGSGVLARWSAMGFRVAAEGFAERRYAPDGTLVPRGRADALIHQPEEAAEQASRIVLAGEVTTSGGGPAHVSAETICLHGDSPGALAIARAVRARLEAEGIEIRPLRS